MVRKNEIKSNDNFFKAMKKKQHKGVKENQTNLGKEISLSGCVFFFFENNDRMSFQIVSD